MLAGGSFLFGLGLFLRVGGGLGEGLRQLLLAASFPGGGGGRFGASGLGEMAFGFAGFRAAQGDPVLGLLLAEGFPSFVESFTRLGLAEVLFLGLLLPFHKALGDGGFFQFLPLLVLQNFLLLGEALFFLFLLGELFALEVFLPRKIARDRFAPDIFVFEGALFEQVELFVPATEAAFFDPRFFGMHLDREHFFETFIVRVRRGLPGEGVQLFLEPLLLRHEGDQV